MALSHLSTWKIVPRTRYIKFTKCIENLFAIETFIISIQSINCYSQARLQSENIISLDLEPVGCIFYPISASAIAKLVNQGDKLFHPL